MRIHSILAILLSVLLLGAAPVAAQEAEAPEEAPRAETGGAQTLEDILARQRGDDVADGFRRDATGDPDGAAATIDQLGTLGGASSSEVYRALRFGSAEVTVSSSSSMMVVFGSGSYQISIASVTLRKVVYSSFTCAFFAASRSLAQ